MRRILARVTHAPALLALASRFPLLQLRFCVQLKRDAELPATRAPCCTAGWGTRLKAVDERAFHALYGEHDPLQPKAYGAPQWGS